MGHAFIGDGLGENKTSGAPGAGGEAGGGWRIPCGLQAAGGTV